MAKDSKVVDGYNKCCADLQHAPESLAYFKKIATADKNLLEALVCEKMGWRWIYETLHGFDAEGNTPIEIKNNCFHGNTPISGVGKFMNVNAIAKVKAFIADKATLAIPCWVHGVLEAIIEVEPITNGMRSNFLNVLIVKSVKGLKLKSWNELVEISERPRGERPQMPSPEIRLSNWCVDDYTVTKFVDTLTEEAYTQGLYKLINEGTSK